MLVIKLLRLLMTSSTCDDGSVFKYSESLVLNNLHYLLVWISDFQFTPLHHTHIKILTLAVLAMRRS